MNKIAIVTGASSGIGLSTSTALAAAGYHVVMVCRDRDRANAAEHIVAAAAAGAPPSMLLADLSSQAEIRGLAHEKQQRFPQVDVLINNPGATFSEREMTVDGIERTFALNVLAPFLLTNQLLGVLNAAPTTRIVMIGSEVHAARLDFDNLQGDQHYGFLKAYKASKLANLLLAYELARRVAATPPSPSTASVPARQRHASGTTCTASHSDSAKS